MDRPTRTLTTLWATVAVGAALCNYCMARSAERPPAHPRRVMVFYYPWYGTANGPGGAGRTVHWGRIDAVNKDIAASTHYPMLGAYDSHDTETIDQHCQWASAAPIDTLIVSWWGHGDYTDRAMDKILDACARHSLKACIYYETVPKPQTAETAARDIIKVLEKHGEHPAYLKVDGSPVVFVYGRALNELGLTGWYEAVQTIKTSYKGDVTAIGDQFSYGAARVFDGVHTYNTAGTITNLTLDQLRAWACGTYPSWVQLADRANRISTVTIIPGYDDTKIRTPGLAVQRFDGKLYEVQWDCAMKADPDWVLITSFKEWHEGAKLVPRRDRSFSRDVGRGQHRVRILRVARDLSRMVNVALKPTSVRSTSVPELREKDYETQPDCTSVVARFFGSAMSGADGPAC